MLTASELDCSRLSTMGQDYRPQLHTVAYSLFSCQVYIHWDETMLEWRHQVIESPTLDVPVAMAGCQR